MTTRRAFIAGLLATAAAPAIPAQPATIFSGLDLAAPGGDTTVWWLTARGYATLGPMGIIWSEQGDYNDWGPAPSFKAPA